MRTAATVAQMLVRVCGTIQIVLGILFWSANASFLVPVHILVGLVLVLALWTLALLAARAGAPAGFVAFALLWGLLLPVLGLSQTRLLTGDGHWAIQALHLLVGLAAIGMAESLGRIARRAPARAAA
jgi:hypothetical protein